MNPRPPSPELFDQQAAAFDRRAGLSEAVCRAVAQAVGELGELRAGDWLVEIGAGTGQIGQWFGAPWHYCGLDLSDNMLREFPRRDGHVLLRADANAPWPLADGAAKALFGSRALHLLDQAHVAAEAFRVAAASGATLFIGRVLRAPESIRARLARELRQRLRRLGYDARGEQPNRQLITACVALGATPLEPVTVAHWPVRASPQQSLAAWRSLTGLGGVPVPAPVRETILTELEDWAAATFGSLDEAPESEEAYVLQPIRISGRF